MKDKVPKALGFFLCATILWAGGFDKSLTKDGITFDIDVEDGTLTITPHGLAIDNTPIERKIDAEVLDAKIVDLNGDGAPEIYIFLVSAGSGSYGKLIAYSSNHNKSVTPIHLPKPPLDSKLLQGYMGHDHFEIKGKYLIRSFPIYRKEDPNCCPTGGRRILYYVLEPGEAMWQLRLVKFCEKIERYNR